MDIYHSVLCLLGISLFTSQPSFSPYTAAEQSSNNFIGGVVLRTDTCRKDNALSADSIIARHIRSMGGTRALGYIVSVHEQNTNTASSFVGELEDYWYLLGKKLKATKIFPDRKDIEYATRCGGFFVSNSIENPDLWGAGLTTRYEQLPPLSDALWGQSYYSKAPFWLNRARYVKSILRTDTSQDTSYIIEVLLRRRYVLRLYIDPCSYMVIRFSKKPYRNTDWEYEHQYSDFQTTSFGYRYASQMEVEYEAYSPERGDFKRLQKTRILEFNFPGQDTVFRLEKPYFIKMAKRKGNLLRPCFTQKAYEK